MSPIPLHMLGINRRYFLGIFSETFRISTFSTIAPSYAKQIGRSPRVRSLERAKKQESLNPIQHNIPPQLPLALFDEAHKAGALGIPGSKAVHVLSQFQALGRRPSQKAIQQLCADENVEPATLSILAHILLRSGHQSNILTGHNLFLAASTQHEETATLHLISQALAASPNQLRNPDLISARQHLDHLVASNNPEALTLLGLIREQEGDTIDALGLYNRACSTTTTTTGNNNSPKDSSDAVAFAKALLSIARLQQRQGNTSSAKAALEKAAYSYDNPYAYFHLASNHIALTSPKYFSYMLKAASSGVIAAAHELGLFYFAQSLGMIPSSISDNDNTRPADLAKTVSVVKPISTPVTAEKCAWATEWFTVSATTSSSLIQTMSQFYLAILLRSGGDPHKGLQQLILAAEHPGRVRLLEGYREQWFDGDLNFLSQGNYELAGFEGQNNKADGLQSPIMLWVERGMGR